MANPNLVRKRESWASGTSYQAGDVVEKDGYQITCQTSHFAGTYNTDVMSGYWRMSSPMKNRIINGDQAIDQRWNGGAISAANIVNFMVDRFSTNSNVASLTTKVNGGQNQGSYTPPNGFAKYFQYNSITSAGIGAGEYLLYDHRIEGYNIADLAWGTTDAKPATLHFWVRAAVAGTYSIVIAGTSGNRYIAGYTVNAPNVFEYKAISIAAPTSSMTVGSSNGIGIAIYFTVACGATNQTSNLNVWQGGGGLAATGQVDLLAASGRTFNITGIMLNEGPAPAKFSLFSNGSFSDELQACQRYYEKNTLNETPGNNIGLAGGVFGFGTGDNNAVVQYQRLGQVFFKVQKRAIPTAYCWSPSGVQNTGFAGDGGSILASGSCTPQQVGVTGFNVTSTPGGYSTNYSTVFFHWTAEAEL